jgi:hypothetical protein
MLVVKIINEYKMTPFNFIIAFILSFFANSNAMDQKSPDTEPTSRFKSIDYKISKVSVSIRSCPDTNIANEIKKLSSSNDNIKFLTYVNDLSCFELKEDEIIIVFENILKNYQLNRLSISNCEISPNVIKSFAQIFPNSLQNLDSLQLRIDPETSGKSLGELMSYLPKHLTSFLLTVCSDDFNNIDYNAFNKYISSLYNLRSFALHASRKSFPKWSLHEISKTLVDLDFPSFNLGGQGSELGSLLNHIPNLKSLILRNCNLTSEDYQKFGKYIPQKLETLNISVFSNLKTTDSLCYLMLPKTLRVFSCSYHQIKNRYFYDSKVFKKTWSEIFSGLPNLESFNGSECNMYDDEILEFIPFLQEPLRKF